MGVEWAGYEPFDPGVDRPLDQVSRREARDAFKFLMASKEARINQLRGLMSRNGLVLGTDNAELQRLNDWFCAEVEGDPTTGRLLSRWYAVVNDLALFLGEVIIGRSPGLKWVMYDKGVRHISYQRHVLMGFSRVANPKYNVDVDLLLATYGHRTIAKEGIERDAFVTWVETAVQKA